MPVMTQLLLGIASSPGSKRSVAPYGAPTRMSRACAALILFALGTPTARAQPDFTGKTVTIVSSFAPGGGYSIYADIIARHIGAHLPGRPTVIVLSMPGAGGLNGTQHLFNVAIRDGTVIGVVPQVVAIAQALGDGPQRYDVRAFNWIGRANSNVELQQSWHTAAVKSIDDARAKEVIVGGTGPASSSVVWPRSLNAMFGMKFKVVAGYESATMASIAMERGEIEGIVRPWSVTKTVRPEWLREGRINLLLQYAHARHPEIPQVPRSSTWRKRRSSARCSASMPAAATSAARSWRHRACRRRRSQCCAAPSWRR